MFIYLKGGINIIFKYLNVYHMYLCAYVQKSNKPFTQAHPYPRGIP